MVKNGDLMWNRNLYHKNFKAGQLAKGKGHLTHEAHAGVVDQRSVDRRPWCQLVTDAAGPGPGRELPLPAVTTA